MCYVTSQRQATVTMKARSVFLKIKNSWAKKKRNLFLLHYVFYKKKIDTISRVQMKSWAGEALETVSCCAFLKRRLIGAC
jgi:hypothetical protein